MGSLQSHSFVRCSVMPREASTFSKRQSRIGAVGCNIRLMLYKTDRGWYPAKVMNNTQNFQHLLQSAE
jgi:hypothetical protein